MDVLVVRDYLETKKQRAKLASQFSKLGKELSVIQAKETELITKVDSDCLITAKSVRVINGLLESHRPLWFDSFPVSFAHIGLKNGRLRVSVVFTQPLFSGWKTEAPYRSWQSCPRSLETPEPPSENHIPQFTQVVDYWELPVICWEQRVDGQDVGELCLWVDEKHGVLFRWDGE